MTTPATEAESITLLPTFNDFCWFCGLPLQREIEKRGDFATQDHIVPKSRNGKGPGNFVTSCRACNGRKKAFSLSLFREQHGGGVFWGEMFHPARVNDTTVRPTDASAFQLWLKARLADPSDRSWMACRRTISALRSMTKDVERSSPVPRPLGHRAWRVKVTKLPWFFGFGARWDKGKGRFTFYVPLHVVTVGWFWVR